MPVRGKKIYLTNQGCDLVAVIDAKSRLIMRYIPIGDASDKAPHDIEVSVTGCMRIFLFTMAAMSRKIDTRKDT